MLRESCEYGYLWLVIIANLTVNVIIVTIVKKKLAITSIYILLFEYVIKNVDDFRIAKYFYILYSLFHLFWEL